MLRQMTPVQVQDVKLSSGILAERARINREETLFIQYRKLEESGRLDQLRRAAGENVEVKKHVFYDSDIAKWLEAIGFSLHTHPNAELEKKADEIIDLYEQAQEDDGYLNTYFTVFEPENRWTNLRDRHEMYCAGHLMEAAVAYYFGTGKRKLIDIMCRKADHIDSMFGPDSNRKRGYPGHQEIEMALMKLYQVTDNERYLKLAKFMIDERGRQPNYFELEAQQHNSPGKNRNYEYWQAHKPVREQSEAVGHAVRALYMYCGMADVAAATEDKELLQACETLWRNITRRKMYLTGGAGARHQGESFGEDFELPNGTAYAETCAAIGLVFFAHRMLQINKKAAYADVLERALFNGVLTGVSVDGKRYFYVNPLAYDGKMIFNHGANQRQEWFGCACCPPNIARLLASLEQYLYSTREDSLYIHLYAGSEADFNIGGEKLSVIQKTDYPWDGRVCLTIQCSKPTQATIHLRIPDWCPDYKVTVNGDLIKPAIEDGYLALQREWTGNDKIQLDLQMPIKQVAADPRVEAARGCAALQRGPVVYCAEQVDHEVPVSSLVIPKNAALTDRYDSELLGGCTVIEGDVRAIITQDSDQLYTPAEEQFSKSTRLYAIPYSLWANRGNNAMTVWMAQQ